jgi:hypothetical protein
MGAVMSMSDTELLESAAKAAGLDVVKRSDGERPGEVLVYGWHRGIWRPLTDDGDALRLAVKLRISVEPDFERVDCYMNRELLSTGFIYGMSPHKGDLNAATRRSIVYAAAVLGERNEFD